MKAAGSSEKLIHVYQTRWRQIPEDSHFFKKLIVTLKNIMYVICNLKLMDVTIHIVMFWVMRPCSLVRGYQNTEIAKTQESCSAPH
jgi:hypothetical protein